MSETSEELSTSTEPSLELVATAEEEVLPETPTRPPVIRRLVVHGMTGQVVDGGAYIERGGEKISVEVQPDGTLKRTDTGEAVPA